MALRDDNASPVTKGNSSRDWQRLTGIDADIRNLYHPLRTLSSTRLIQLEPGEFSSELHVSLLEVDLDSDATYEAVSYTWGAEEYDHVVINGHDMPVRRNLWNCLKRLRKTTLPRRVWIDALSICQTDLLEKSNQVGMIHRIFKSASRVLVWVGEHENHSEELFATYSWASRAASWIGLRLRIAEDRQDFEDLDLPPDGPSRRRIICKDFLSRPYWRRTWVIQEIISNTEVQICCGKDSMSWGDMMMSRGFKEAQEEWGTTRPPYRNPPPFFNRVPEPWRHFYRIAFHRPQLSFGAHLHAYAYGFGDDLHTIMKQFAFETTCSDRRDKVYAFVSHDYRNYIGQERIVVDYEIDLSMLCITLIANKADLEPWETRALENNGNLPKSRIDVKDFIKLLELTWSECEQVEITLQEMSRKGGNGSREELFYQAFRRTKWRSWREGKSHDTNSD